MARSSSAGSPAERGHEQRRPAGVGGGVGVRHLRRAAGRGRPRCATPCGGTSTTARDSTGRAATGWAQTSSPAWPETTKPPSRAGRHVVGVALEPVGQGERPRRRRAGRRRRRPGPRASTMPPTIAAEDDPRPRLCGIRLVQRRRSARRLLAERARRRPASPARRGGARRAGRRRPPSPSTSISQPGVRDLADQGVVQLQGQAEAVEAGAEVGAGGRDLDGHRPGRRRPDGQRASLGRPAARRPRRRRRRTTVSTRSVKVDSAVSMSLRPWPVTVTTTCWPA